MTSLTPFQSPREIALAIITREGGHANDPDDPGGATRYGVTIHTMRRLGLDLNGDGAVTPADLEHLSRERAVEIYLEHYFIRPGVSRLPQALQASVFDMLVNSGANAVRILQRLLTEMGFACIDDGAIGPQTVAQAERAYKAAPQHLADAYAIARRNYYYALADNRPASRKYARTQKGGKGGWILRAEEFMHPRFHLTPAQHQARTAAWG